jgi:hypothetical protein
MIVKSFTAKAHRASYARNPKNFTAKTHSAGWVRNLKSFTAKTRRARSCAKGTEAS